MKKVLILGGYGNFGKRIAELLSELPDTCLMIGGRSLAKAEVMVAKTQPASLAILKPIVIDINAADFELRLRALEPDVVIHTGGPFQGQDYRVPIACINVGANYIDLADDRRFVCDIATLDDAARRKGVIVISGASTVPGLSSAVVDHYRHQFAGIDSLDMAIVPGNKAERGEATIRAILSYTGRPFPVYSRGRWCDAFGWMDARSEDFGDIVGRRWLANVDVPDLELFVARYAIADSVRFQAGLELPILHLTMVAMAGLAKLRLIRNWAPFSGQIARLSDLFMRFGSDIGGMQVRIMGSNDGGHAKNITWSLYADKGVGPYIPTISAVILTKKILSGELDSVGAIPCLGLYKLDEFFPYADRLGIYFRETVNA